MIVALVALALIALAAFWLISQNSKTTNPSNVNVSAAADKVGAAADKVGNAVEDATKR